MPEKHIPLNQDDAAILLVDHQPGVLGMVNSLPHDVVKANVGILARLGARTSIPLVITSTRETLEFLGTNIDEVKNSAPAEYENRIARDGGLNAFEDPRFVEAVEATGRQTLIIAGLLTDVCLWHSVVSALEAGYRVRVIADASGTTSELADRVTYDRLSAMGVEVGTTYGTLFELFDDLSTPEGQIAEAVASGQDLAAV